MKASSSKNAIETYAKNYLQIFHSCTSKTLTTEEKQALIEWGYTLSLGFSESELERYAGAMQYVIGLISDWKNSDTSVAMMKKVVSATRKKIGDIEGIKTNFKNPIEIPVIARIFKASTGDIALANQNTRTNKTEEKKVTLTLTEAKKMIAYAIQTLKTIKTIENDFDASKVALAIELLTGRRLSSEVFDTASFSPITENQVSFQGQAKNEEKRLETYNIYTLGNSELISEKHEELIDYMIEKSWYKPGTNQSERIRSNIVAYVNKAISQYPSNTENFEFHPHDFRKFYACYVFKIYSHTYDFARFIGEQLGHGGYDNVGNFVADAETTGSYAKFIFID